MAAKLDVCFLEIVVRCLASLGALVERLSAHLREEGAPTWLVFQFRQEAAIKEVMMIHFYLRPVRVAEVPVELRPHFFLSSCQRPLGLCLSIVSGQASPLMSRTSQILPHARSFCREVGVLAPQVLANGLSACREFTLVPWLLPSRET